MASSMNRVKDIVNSFRARRTEDTQRGPTRGSWALCDGTSINVNDVLCHDVHKTGFLNTTHFSIVVEK
jgi:hypothetical protein